MKDNPYRNYGKLSPGLDTNEYGAERYNDLLRQAAAHRRLARELRVQAGGHTSILRAIGRFVASFL